MIVVIVLFILLFIASFIVSKNNVFSPAVMTSSLWLFCLSLSLIINHELPPLSKQFLTAISLWVFLYVFFSLLMQSVSSTHFDNITPPSKFVRDVYFWISVMTFPLLLVFAYNAIHWGPTGVWSEDLRLAALGKTKHFTDFYGGYYNLIWKASYFIELYFYSKKNRKRVFILGFFLLSFGFFTMAKVVFLEFFIVTICILYFKKVVSIKHLLSGFLILFFLFVSFQTLRQRSDTNKKDFLVLYVLGHMSAFDTLEPASSAHSGEYVFRFFYAIAYKLGISDIEPVSPLLDWIQKPIVTNTYTGMHHFFKDFGYWGIAIFSSFFGLFFGWLFKKARDGSPFFILFYSSLVSTILMQYMAEMLFTYLSMHIQLILILYFPFFASKHNLFMIKKKTVSTYNKITS